MLSEPPDNGDVTESNEERTRRVTMNASSVPARESLSVRSVRPAASHLRVYLALALGVLCLAFSPILTRWSAVPGPVSALYRMVIAMVVLAMPFGRSVRKMHAPVGWRPWLIAVAAGVFFALDLALWNTSLFHTTAANSTLLDNDAPILVGLGAIVLYAERPGRSYWLGLGLALLGMGVIVGEDMLAHPGFGAGDALALLAGAFYGASMLLTQRVRASLSALATLYVGSVTGFVLLLGYCIVTRTALVGFSLQSYLALLALGLVTQVVGWLAVNYALGHLPASVVSVTLIGQPVLAAVLAVPLLGEALGLRQVAGGLIALSGIYLVNRGFGRKLAAQRSGPAT